MKTKNRKPAAKASAARVPSVIVKVYPHVVHVHVNGEEQPARRDTRTDAGNVEGIRAALAAEFPTHKVSVEHRNERDQLIKK